MPGAVVTVAVEKRARYTVPRQVLGSCQRFKASIQGSDTCHTLYLVYLSKKNYHARSVVDKAARGYMTIYAYDTALCLVCLHDGVL